uniref:Uncharacterized protein n=1 Tax=Rhizophora mucronata TaxID=61149 RepID=A0A2P2PF72_RHIMU
MLHIQVFVTSVNINFKFYERDLEMLLEYLYCTWCSCQKLEYRL